MGTNERSQDPAAGGTGTELAKAGEAQLAGYSQPEREAIVAYGKRIKAFMKGANAITDAQAYALANIALAHGLDPFVGEIWYIPRIGISMGIEGYRKLARRVAPYTVDFRLMTPAEAGLHNVDGDAVGFICELIRLDLAREAVQINTAAGRDVVPITPFLGVGIWRNGDQVPGTKTPAWVARKRSEADALRQAFDLPFGYGERDEEAGVEWLPPEVVESAERTNGLAVDLDRARQLLRGADGDDAIEARLAELRAANAKAKAEAEQAIDGDFEERDPPSQFQNVVVVDAPQANAPTPQAAAAEEAAQQWMKGF